MERFSKNTSGITLIALVVTIIVLLILAAVSLNLVAGESGILSRAEKATNETVRGSAKEEVQLELADLLSKYYEEKYPNHNASLAGKTAGEYIKENANGTTTSGYTYEISETKDENGDYEVKVKDKNSKLLATGKLTSKGKLSWENSNSSTEEKKNTEEDKKDEIALLEVNKKYESKTELKDANGNKIVVPAGFKIVSDATTNNATTVDQGIVIEDVTGTDTNGSQFVWIPVGDIKKADGTTTSIALNRYDFDSNGVATEYSGSSIEEDKTNTTTLKNYGNTISENINAFKTSVATNGGFYIGRYEARKNSSGKLTTVKTDSVWNNITQPNAATNSKNMYSTGVTSELMNSYAWDTATLFLQTFGENNKYSRQSRTETSFLTNGTDTDKQCNVYDMASNVLEWTTETCSNSVYPCTLRGGYCVYSCYYTSSRNGNSTSSSDSYIGFRPLLYF